MYIQFLSCRKVSLFMKDYIKKSTSLFGEEIIATVSSTAKKGLQNIDKSSNRLEKKDE